MGKRRLNLCAFLQSVFLHIRYLAVSGMWQCKLSIAQDQEAWFSLHRVFNFVLRLFQEFIYQPSFAVPTGNCTIKTRLTKGIKQHVQAYSSISLATAWTCSETACKYQRRPIAYFHKASEATVSFGEIRRQHQRTQPLD